MGGGGLGLTSGRVSLAALGVLLMVLGFAVCVWPMSQAPVEQSEQPQPANAKPLEVVIVGYTASPDGWIALSGSVRGGVRPIHVQVDWGDGTVDSGLAGEVMWLHQYAEAGVYTITVKAVDAAGAEASDSITVTSHTVHYSSILDLLGIPHYRWSVGLALIAAGALLAVSQLRGL